MGLVVAVGGARSVIPVLGVQHQVLLLKGLRAR